MSQQDVNESGAGELEEMYTVVCVHCGRQAFKFSENLLCNCGELKLVCPLCGGQTEVKSSGEIGAG